MWTTYKGIKIITTSRHGYKYYRVEGQKQLHSYLKDAKLAVDRMLAETE